MTTPNMTQQRMQERKLRVSIDCDLSVEDIADVMRLLTFVATETKITADVTSIYVVPRRGS